MRRIRARLVGPSDGSPPVTGTAAGCTGEAVTEAAAEAVAVLVAAAVPVVVAVALGVGVSDAVGVGVSVGICPASAFGAPDASPITTKAPTIAITRPARKIRPIPFSFRYTDVSGNHSPKRARAYWLGALLTKHRKNAPHERGLISAARPAHSRKRRAAHRSRTS